MAATDVADGLQSAGRAATRLATLLGKRVGLVIREGAVDLEAPPGPECTRVDDRCARAATVRGGRRGPIKILSTPTPSCDNLRRAYETFPDKTFVARTPLIPGVNDDEEHIRAVLAFIKPYKYVVDYELCRTCVLARASTGSSAKCTKWRTSILLLPNRSLFAFAAYNCGPANMAKLRKEAEKRGLNPDVWFDNVENVTADKIGLETTTYVRNIFKYYVSYKLTTAAREAQQAAKETIKKAP